MATDRSRRTIDAIMEAAHDEFSEMGPAGARVDRVAHAAGVNKQRIYAYFGNKEGLFSAVLSRAFARLTAAVPIPDDLPALRHYARDVFDYHAKDLTLVRLLAWEGLQFREKAVLTDYDRAAYYEQSVARLAGALGVAPALASHAVLTIVAAASWPHVVPQQRRLMVAGSRHELTADVEALRDSIAMFGEAIADRLAATAND